MNAKELARCRTRLERFLGDLLAPLGRKDRRHWGEVYIRGLLLDRERTGDGGRWILFILVFARGPMGRLVGLFYERLSGWAVGRCP